MKDFNISEIVKVFEDALDKTHYEYNIEIKNFGKCIEISNENFIFDEDDLMFIWVRTLNMSDKCTAEIATIQLPESIRRRGILDNILNNLLKIDWLTKIGITGVSTAPMRNFCIKHDMKTINDRDYYIEKV